VFDAPKLGGVQAQDLAAVLGPGEAREERFQDGRAKVLVVGQLRRVLEDDNAGEEGEDEIEAREDQGARLGVQAVTAPGQGEGGTRGGDQNGLVATAAKGRGVELANVAEQLDARKSLPEDGLSCHVNLDGTGNSEEAQVLTNRSQVPEGAGTDEEGVHRGARCGKRKVEECQRRQETSVLLGWRTDERAGAIRQRRAASFPVGKVEEAVGRGGLVEKGT